MTVYNFVFGLLLCRNIIYTHELQKKTTTNTDNTTY